MTTIKKGTTNVSRYVMLVDSAAGTPETAYTITNLDMQYTRNQSTPAAKADATALAATNTAHTDNYAIEIDATSSPGLYRIDWPDAAFATGADKVILVVTGTGLHPAVEEIDLVNYDPEDGVRLGLTALPNAAADAAGGLPISDAGGLDLDAVLSGNTPQTGDSFAIVNDGTYGNSAIRTRGDIAWVTGGDATAANQSTIIGYIDTEIAAILIDTGTTLDGKLTTMQSDVTAILADTNELQTDDVPGLIAALNDLNAAGIRTAVGLASANLDTQLGDIPTVAEFEARTIVAASYFDPAADTVARVTLVDTVTTNTDMVSEAPAASAIADAVWDEAAADHVGAGSFGVQCGTDIDAILADTNELQSDDIPTTLATLATAAALATLDAIVDRVAVGAIGNVTNAGTGTETFVYGGVTATVTVDASGNRTIVWS